MNGKCDRVMDSRKGGTHLCNRRSKVVSHRTHFIASLGQIPYRLEYCTVHSKHAYYTELPSLRVVEVIAC